MILPRFPAKVPVTSGPRDTRWRVPVICLALAAITFAVFGQTVTHEFIDFDDDAYVYNNPVVEQGLTPHGVAWAFTRVHSSNWHPLTWLSHMLDVQLYGLKPGGHHLTNALIHTATVIALFLVLRQMTGAIWRCAFVAAVFAIHPLRVESVAWVAERKDVLSGLFFMLTLGAYVRYARGPWSAARYGLVVVLFAMGLMCKPMLVTLPFVLLLLDYWPLQRPESAGKLVREKLPLLALSAAGCMVTLLSQTKALQAGESVPFSMRLDNALTSCVIYLREMVWPSGLAVLYPYPQHGQPASAVVAAVILLTAISALAVWQRKKKPWLLMGWAWYLVMLLPVIGIIQAGAQAYADRYTYLPEIGVVLALTWWVAERGTNRIALAGLMIATVAALMVCAWKQTGYWKNNETLWTHTISCTRDNYLAHYNLGTAFLNQGKLDDAMREYQAALEINPASVDSLINLGDVFLRMGKPNDAIAQFQRAVDIDPNRGEAHYNLGIALSRMGREEEAISQYEYALELKPADGKAHDDLGTLLLQHGRVNEAITQYRQALEINPNNEKAQNNLGNALLQNGELGEAIACFRKALQLKPNEPSIENNLAWLLATSPQASLRNGNEAVNLAGQANALTGGGNPIVLHTLAGALAEAGRFPEAMAAARRALAVAQAQSNTLLAGELQSEMKLYQAGHPYHLPASAAKPPSH
jgi:Tfp pilus assembly protein PilF